MAKNQIISGWGKGSQIIKNGDKRIGFHLSCKPDKLLGGKEFHSNPRNGVASYEVIDKSSVKNTSNMVKRGILGSLLAGDAGLLAGALSSKNTNTYTIAVEFKDGKRSLIELDDEYYKIFIRDCFV